MRRFTSGFISGRPGFFSIGRQARTHLYTQSTLAASAFCNRRTKILKPVMRKNRCQADAGAEFFRNQQIRFADPAQARAGCRHFMGEVHPQCFAEALGEVVLLHGGFDLQAGNAVLHKVKNSLMIYD
jgi:hypothetical protein